MPKPAKIFLIFTDNLTPRKPAGFFEGQAGVNRLFRSSLAFAPSLTNPGEVETKQAVTYVVDQFIKRPTMV